MLKQTLREDILLLLTTVLLYVEHVGGSCLLPDISPDKIRRSVMTGPS